MAMVVPKSHTIQFSWKQTQDSVTLFVERKSYLASDTLRRFHIDMFQRIQSFCTNQKINPLYFFDVSRSVEALSMSLLFCFLEEILGTSPLWFFVDENFTFQPNPVLSWIHFRQRTSFVHKFTWKCSCLFLRQCCCQLCTALLHLMSLHVCENFISNLLPIFLGTGHVHVSPRISCCLFSTKLQSCWHNKILRLVPNCSRIELFWKKCQWIFWNNAGENKLCSNKKCIRCSPCLYKMIARSFRSLVIIAVALVLVVTIDWLDLTLWEHRSEDTRKIWSLDHIKTCMHQENMWISTLW